MSKNDVLIQSLGLVPYLPTYQAMQRFTENRHAKTVDEWWILEHSPVYTLGQAGQYKHIHYTGPIPIYSTDRGGQVTYHGPGQLIVYFLMDLKRQSWGIKAFIRALEQGVIDYLKSHHIEAQRRDKAPGVYVEGRKVSALGLRIRRGCSYHGLSLNVNMDLSPFNHIHPCGYAGLEMTQLRDLGFEQSLNQVATQLLPYLLETLDCETLSPLNL